jgi:hypothetical protein
VGVWGGNEGVRDDNGYVWDDNKGHCIITSTE